MSVKINITLVSFFLLGISSVPLLNSHADTYSNPSKAERIEQLIEGYIKKEDFQGSILIAEKGEILFKKAYGMADREKNIKNTIETQFLIGSLTKSFVAITVLQLVEEGLLDLNAPLKQYIPELDDKLAKDLTLHILLKHQSGLSPHLERITEFEDKDVSSEEILEIINTSSLSFIPETKYQYSNLNYTLSAIAIENATGKTYAQVLQERTFTPLQMNNSGVERKSNYPKKRAKGYRKATLGIKNDENIVSYALGSGDIYSTVEDLLKWDQALYGTSFLSEESLKLLFDGENDAFGNYSYGFRILDYQRGKEHDGNGVLMRHGGSMDGFLSNLHRYSDDKLTVIILGNIRSFPIRNMTFELKEIALGFNAKERDRSIFE